MKQTFATMTLLFALSLPMAASAAGNYVWTQQTGAGSRNWRNIASSADGLKIAAAGLSNYLYISSDGGTTWVAKTGLGIKNFMTTTISADGSKIAAGNFTDYIFTSSDGGATWIQRTSSGIQDWYGITSSADGTKLSAVGGDSTVYSSNDGGTTWAPRASFGAIALTSIASSADGTKRVVGDLAIMNSGTVVNPGGYIYTSSDSGATWIQRTSSGARHWISITSSTDGTRLGAADFGNPLGSPDGYLYTSADSGVTWTRRDAAGKRSWRGITSSANGTMLAAVTYGDGNVSLSSDGGITWVQVALPGASSLLSITSSANGKRLAAVDYGGYIYIGVIPDPSGTITLTPSTVNRGQSATLSYTLSNAGGGAYISNIGYVSTTTPSGSFSVSPSSNTNYQMTLWDTSGTPYTFPASPASLVVNQPPTATLTQSTTSTNSNGVTGNPFTVTWSSTYSSSCTLQSQAPSGGTITNPWASGLSGSQSASPVLAGSWHWWIDCTGLGGTAHQDLYHTVVYACTPSSVCSGGVITNTDAVCGVTTVTCGAPSFCVNNVAICQWPQPSAVGNLTLSPRLVAPSKTVQVSWNVINVSSCTVTGTNGDGTGTNSTGVWNTAAGPKTSSPVTTQVIYTLSCVPLDPRAPIFRQTTTLGVVPTYRER